ncbi:MAG: hypothetical protein Q7S00_05470, partial [bacterium]|nr:hypothetical protein [bacterium]
PKIARQTLRKSILSVASLLNEKHQKEFSGKTYRVVKFAVDVPVRLERFLETRPDPYSEAFGCIAFCLVEFQIIDLETERLNSSGENRHDLYKQRQMAGVKKRLIP